MGKVRVRYVCQNAARIRGAGLGRCVACGTWNSCVEETPLANPKRQSGALAVAANPPQPITEVKGGSEDRIKTAIGEFDRTLGGGIVPGMAALVGGDPGIGKSTLLLQGASQLAFLGMKALYVSAEESPRQTRMRAQRVGALADDLYPHFRIQSRSDLRPYRSDAAHCGCGRFGADHF